MAFLILGTIAIVPLRHRPDVLVSLVPLYVLLFVLWTWAGLKHLERIIETLKKARRLFKQTIAKLRQTNRELEVARAKAEEARRKEEEARLEAEEERRKAEEANRLLAEQSRTDPLTGVLNRRGLTEAAQRLLLQSFRYRIASPNL